MKDKVDLVDLGRRFTKEKKALVPKRDFLDGHPLERKIRRTCFKAGLKHQGHNAADAFNSGLTTPIRTIVSKTYSDMFHAARFTTNELLEGEELEQHLDWMFEELAKYQQDAKALILKHMKELQS